MLEEGEYKKGPPAGTVYGLLEGNSLTFKHTISGYLCNTFSVSLRHLGQLTCRCIGCFGLRFRCMPGSLARLDEGRGVGMGVV